MKSNINLKDNEIVFSVSAKIYSKEAIHKASYVFIDRAYVRLDKPKKGEFSVYLKGKEKLSEKRLNAFKGEFLNEVLNNMIRETVSGKNKKIFEYVIGGAITAALEKPEIKDKKENNEDEMLGIEKEIAKLKKELEKEEKFDFQNDPLKIKKPYEEKRKN